MKELTIIRGTVKHGRKLGRKIGYPTANISLPSNFNQPYGVYSCQIEIGNDQYYGVVAIGQRPTVEANLTANAECYILNFDQDIYEKEIAIKLMEFIRPEIKFASIELLKEQIEKDIEKIKSTLTQQ